MDTLTGCSHVACSSLILTRMLRTTECSRPRAEAITGYNPRVWQLDSAISKHLARDACIIAETEFEKTLPFVRSCQINSDPTVQVVFPLYKLVNQQNKTNFLRPGDQCDGRQRDDQLPSALEGAWKAHTFRYIVLLTLVSRYRAQDISYENTTVEFDSE